ncbi:MAG: leucine-rich repeat domain-containing protein, partial [Clostridia bacterium]|nr:leucine-rich repeat domain-containing protein [Clostridia bacterium]
NNDFIIGKNVETIGEGAFAIYPNNANNSNKKIVVDKENENFAVIDLQDFNTTSSSGIGHGLLTNADNTVVYAYFGSFNKSSYFGEKISDSTAEAEKIQSEKFRFYDKTGNPIQSITEIKSYAFAGVAFTAIRLPMTVKTFGEYLFYESEDVTDMYIESITWTWQSTSFSKKTDGSPEVRVMIYATADGSDSDRENFKMSLVADNIDVGYASASDN